jgi:hypothetical protein
VVLTNSRWHCIGSCRKHPSSSVRVSCRHSRWATRQGCVNLQEPDTGACWADNGCLPPPWPSSCTVVECRPYFPGQRASASCHAAASADARC